MQDCLLPIMCACVCSPTVDLPGIAAWLRAQDYAHSHWDKSWIILESQTSWPEAALIKSPQRPDNST